MNKAQLKIVLDEVLQDYLEDTWSNSPKFYFGFKVGHLPTDQVIKLLSEMDKERDENGKRVYPAQFLAYLADNWGYSFNQVVSAKDYYVEEAERRGMFCVELILDGDTSMGEGYPREKANMLNEEVIRHLEKKHGSSKEYHRHFGRCWKKP